MEHIHLFQHTGGGCAATEGNLMTEPRCDDKYECECGATFKTISSPEVHFTMPQFIAGKEAPEDC